MYSINRQETINPDFDMINRIVDKLNSKFDPNDAYDLDSTQYQFDTPEELEASGYTSFEDFKQNGTDEEHVDALYKVWRNFPVSDVFEPGSTYKTFTISGALEEGAISPSDTFFCDGGEQIEDRYIQCHSHDYGGHGMVDVSGALEKSCNDALMQIAAKEGISLFDKYFASVFAICIVCSLEADVKSNVFI